MRYILFISLSLLLSACGDTGTDCHEQYIPISSVQGSGLKSPLLNQQITTQGIVTSLVYPDAPSPGIMLQSAEPDNDPATAEGIWLQLPAGKIPYQPGQLLQVSATVTEIDGMTTLADAQQIKLCSQSFAVTPLSIRLPLPENISWEALEGMWLSFEQELIVNDNYQLGRYGEILLADKRLYQATEVALPGKPAQQYAALQEKRAFWLSDGIWRQNPDPVRYPAGGLSAANTLRSGDTVNRIEGVLFQDKRGYRLIPTREPEFQQTNPRPAAPQPTPENALRIANFNVLNFFNGADQPVAFPTRRGASSELEFKRQQAKLVAALSALDADIIGLLEIENNGYDQTGALATLVQLLNQAADSRYDFIRTTTAPGTDAIKTALIYRPASVTPVAAAQLNTSAPFDYGNRPPLAQLFRHNASGKEINVTLNHFKSKGSCPDKPSADADQQDGQACWNASRTKAAEALNLWLQQNPVSSAAPYQLIMGDFNAYKMEDPIRRLQQSGWHLLSSTTPGYSYVYRGRAGSLDHILVNTALAEKQHNFQHWAINADEPPVLDYNTEYKSERQLTYLYSADPYRSSDHDPLIATFYF